MNDGNMVAQVRSRRGRRAVLIFYRRNYFRRPPVLRH